MSESSKAKMDKAKDLKITIPLTPSQISLFPEIVKKINSEPEMSMSPLFLKDGGLEVSCFDLSDVLEELKVSTPLEFQRFKKQAESALEGQIQKNKDNQHLIKNFSSALKLVQNT